MYGIIGGIFFVNHASKTQTEEICSYVNSLKEHIKSSNSINKTAILLKSLKQNILFVLIIWFLGCTILGSFFIYIAMIYKGFSIGYTVSAIVGTLGVKAGSIFSIVSLLGQNLIFIPMLFLLSISGINLYQNFKESQYVNLKREFAKHTVFLAISVFVTVICSFIEVYISTNFLLFFKNFF